MISKKARRYFVSCVKLAFSRPDCFNLKELIKHYPAWLSGLDTDRNPMDDERPWIVFAAADFLDSILTKEMRVYEYGSGGSTLFFAKRVKELISAEHNPEWFALVSNNIAKKNITNCSLQLFPAEPDSKYLRNAAADPDRYVADDENYQGMTFRKYASDIDSYDDGYFDVVLIDGRARPSCFKHSLNKVKAGGYIILDNAERPHYSYIHQVARKLGWKKFDYLGPVPQLKYFDETCIWQRTGI